MVQWLAHYTATSRSWVKSNLDNLIHGVPTQPTQLQWVDQVFLMLYPGKGFQQAFYLYTPLQGLDVLNCKVLTSSGVPK